jgi:hypothetical protein
VSSDVDVEVLHKAAMKAVARAMDGDGKEALDTILTIAEMGPVAVHAALCAWSTVTLHGATQGGDPAPGGFWGIDVIDSRTGQAVSIDKMANPAMRDAARIVACVGNDDHSTIAAIIVATEQDPHALVSLMAQSVRLAASVAQQLYGEGSS